MGKFIVSLLLGFILFPVVVYMYLASGSMDVATSAPPLPMEKTLANLAIHARMEKEMPHTVPLKPDEPTLLAGAKVYDEHCATCHGLPNQPAPVIAKGMYPHAPQLLEKDGMVTDDPPGESFWKVKNGIRLTGMPGFSTALTKDEIWQVSLLLANADKLPASVQRTLASAPLNIGALSPAPGPSPAPATVP
ncbi:MAG TPA: c-type cytochrome [Terriglobia bacterium]|nr:c-type cytochrome [Terriglobia bacterium]